MDTFGPREFDELMKVAKYFIRFGIFLFQIAVLIVMLKIDIGVNETYRS